MRFRPEVLRPCFSTGLPSELSWFGQENNKIIVFAISEQVNMRIKMFAICLFGPVNQCIFSVKNGRAQLPPAFEVNADWLNDLLASVTVADHIFD
jgi:hypothetical protein